VAVGGIRCIRTPPKSPRANAYCESFIGRIKHQALDHFCCLSLKQLDYSVRAWLHYYHTQRSHQGVDIGNKGLDPSFRLTAEGKIRHKRQLGGIVSHYHRDAA